jgi:hypothetical protein
MSIYLSSPLACEIYLHLQNVSNDYGSPALDYTLSYHSRMLQPLATHTSRINGQLIWYLPLKKTSCTLCVGEFGPQMRSEPFQEALRDALCNKS